MVRADPAQVRALLVACRSADHRQRAVAVHAEPIWNGPDALQAGGIQARVRACRSPLAVREALIEDGASGEWLVILTPCSGSELGLDVLARLVKGDVLLLDPYSSVLALFGATVLDPQLVEERWLIDELIAIAPGEGWPDHRPAGGVLDIDLAWRTWQEARLGLPLPPRDVSDVLALRARPDVGVALAALPPEQRSRVAARWGGGGASPVEVIVELLAAGRGWDVAAVGLVAEVLWATTDDAVLAQTQSVARARLEPLLGRDRLDTRSATVWGEVSTALLQADPNAPAFLDLAEGFLAEAGVIELVVLSDILPRGFDERLALLGRAIARNDLPAAVEALHAVRRHHHGERRAHRLEMAEAAVRLLRRRGLPRPAMPSTFAGAVADYAADGAWVDEALGLLTEGDHVPDVAGAYSALGRDVALEQAERAVRFASVLADWSESEPLPDPRLVPVERVLDDVVAPVAVAAPVLVVVCDGMGLPVAHRLMRDLVEEGWAPAVPADREAWPLGVAILPTVTEASRASLLSGRRVFGGQAEEREGFSTHPGLRAASSSTRPPVLFHKAGLVGPSGMALPDEVRRLVADPDQRVIGVVVNSVDDHLARGDQVRVGWDLVSLRPLPWLLDAAVEAGRVVVLSADHGHVLHGPDSLSRPTPGGGERWRTPPPPAGEGEVEVAGPRVLLGGGRVVLPAQGRLRYGGYKHGYHGGATPQEVLVPVEVLARRLPQGWTYRPVTEPAWWAEAGAPSRTPPVSGVRPPTVPSGGGGQPTLFERGASVEPAWAEAGWVGALLAAPAFVGQRGRARLPRPLPEERLRRYLEILDANGGTIPLTAMAARTGEPPDTLRMALTLVQRLLNVDGAELLTVRADGAVVLNRELAAMQFEIEAP